jgi:hypothetical protein
LTIIKASAPVLSPKTWYGMPLGQGQVDAIRATLDPSLVPFEHDGGLELPWLSVVTSVA